MLDCRKNTRIVHDQLVVVDGDLLRVLLGVGCQVACKVLAVVCVGKIVCHCKFHCCWVIPIAVSHSMG